MSLTMLTQMDTSVYRYMYIMYVKKILLWCCGKQCHSDNYVHMFLCCQVQAVTIEGPGNFSSPVTVAVGGCKESDNSVVIGVPVAIVVVIILITMVTVIILLTIVSGLLIAYTIR